MADAPRQSWLVEVASGILTAATGFVVGMAPARRESTPNEPLPRLRV